MSEFIVPDAKFPSDSVYGIPMLKPDLQAQFCDLPIRGWGCLARKDRMRGTWHFYVDDKKFNGLWKHPEGVLKTKCINTCEVNFSTDDQMPFAVAIYRTYQKRWLSRYWQEYGLPIFVDLNVADPYQELNLVGVPRGWRSFSTSACDSRLDVLQQHLNLARDFAERKDINFLVYGGTTKTGEFCQENDLVHVPDARWVARLEKANG